MTLNPILRDDSPEQAIWHGKPFGRHAVGLLHYVDPKIEKQSHLVDTESETNGWPVRHWPALAMSTIYAVAYDAINVYVGDRDAYERTTWRWFPTHLELAWRAGDVEIGFKVAMADGDTAQLRVTVTNHGSAPLRDTLTVRGDENQCNYTAKGQSWARQDTACRREGVAAIVDKTLHQGLCHEFFPYFSNLKPDDQQFEWSAFRYSLACVVGGEGWRHGIDGDTWLTTRELNLDAKQTFTFDVALRGAWFGTSPHEDVQPPAIVPVDDVIAQSRDDWQAFFDRVPAPGAHWPAEIVRLYYKAWTSVRYNTVEPSDMLFYDSKLPIGVCCKVAPSTMACCPATWESALIALCMSMTEPRAACDMIEAIFQPMHEDGYLGELPGSLRSSQLPAIEAPIVWACYRAAGEDRAFLQRIYPALRKNLLYKAHHPTWFHHGPVMVRNLSYALVSGRYLKRIAETLDRPQSELDEIAQLIDHMRRGINAYWDDDGGFYRANFIPALGYGFANGKFEDGTDGEALMPLIAIDDEARKQRLIEIINDHYLTDAGLVRRRPEGLPKAMSGTYQSAAKHADFTLKESNLVMLLKAVRDADRATFDRMVAGTLANIRADGDFYECYSLDGRGMHNGPGSIFGASAVIFAILLSDGSPDPFDD